MSYFISFCEHLILLVIQHNLSHAAAPVSNAHTYRLLIVKELRLLITGTACCILTKRFVCLQRGKEYKPFGSFRQPVFLMLISSQPDIATTLLTNLSLLAAALDWF
jgi:hypothetical protein